MNVFPLALNSARCVVGANSQSEKHFETRDNLLMLFCCVNAVKNFLMSVVVVFVVVVMFLGVENSNVWLVM
jgi:hypothetical protein